MTKQNEKLKICFFINGFREGGAERQCAYLINELNKDENITVSLIYFFEGENFQLIDKHDLAIYKVPSESLYSVKNISIINKIIAEISPDIILSWLQAPDVLSFFIKLKFPKIKWVLAERNSKHVLWWDYRFIARTIFARFADAIISNSKGGQAYWKQRLVASRKLTVIPNILYHNKLNQTYNTNIISGSPVILFAGRLKMQKNVFVVTKAFCKLADTYKQGKFYIIGEGDLRNEIQDIINKNRNQEQVIVMPFQNNIAEYFVAADVFVNISFYEGLPNTVIENTVLNKKMVVSAITEHEDILGPDFPYYVKDINDVDLVCKTIEAAVADNDFVKHLEHAKKFISSLEPELITNKYKEMFYYIKNSKKVDLKKFESN